MHLQLVYQKQGRSNKKIGRGGLDFGEFSIEFGPIFYTVYVFNGNKFIWGLDLNP